MVDTNDKARQKAAKIAEQVKRSRGKGLNAARIFLVSRLKETLNTPAPKISKISHLTGNQYYKIVTPATLGAPPRKVTGAMQRSLTSYMEGEGKAVIGCSAMNKSFSYPLYHEKHDHPWLMPTFTKYKHDLETIIGSVMYLNIKV